MARISFLPKEVQYFSMFSQMTSHIFDASKLLVDMLNGKREGFAEYAKQIKDIEHACDDVTHSITTRLNKSFITPFDREDIFLLCTALDDIVDLIEAAARRMIMYDVKESTAHARGLADVIYRMAVELHEVVRMLSKPNGISDRLVQMHTLENEGDDIYHTSIAELFHDASDPMYVIKWKDIYENLEATVDRGEYVANIIESIILKNA